MTDETPGVAFHIQATPDGGAISQLLVEPEDAFVVCDRHGDVPAYFEGELGFYYEGTRHLRWLELRLNGGRPLLLGAEISPDNDQISIALTNADLTAGEGTGPPHTNFLDPVLSVYHPPPPEAPTVRSFPHPPCTVTPAVDFRP